MGSVSTSGEIILSESIKLVEVVSMGSVSTSGEIILSESIKLGDSVSISSVAISGEMIPYPTSDPVDAGI